MAKNNNLTDFLTGVADAIRTKKGTSGLINPQDFESEISSIKTEKPEQEKSVSISTNGTTEVTPDSGKALSKVTVTTNVQPTLQEKTVAPTTTQQIVTADSGKYGLSKVTVSAIQTEEKIQAAGTSNIEVTPTSGKYLTKVTVQPTPTETKTVIPTTAAQTITPTSGKYLSKITVEAVTSSIDSNIVAENIKKDVTILGVTGTLESGSNGTPIDVATEQEMASILSNATANDNGKIYRYTGTTGTYVNGALYWLEVPEKPVEPSTDELAGTWVFNDTIDFSTLSTADEFDFSWSINYNVSGDLRDFVSLGASRLNMEDENGNPMLVGSIAYIPFSSGKPEPIVAYSFEGDFSMWQNDSYKTITITSKLSEVDSGGTLLAWLQANATKQ